MRSRAVSDERVGGQGWDNSAFVCYSFENLESLILRYTGNTLINILYSKRTRALQVQRPFRHLLPDHSVWWHFI